MPSRNVIKHYSQDTFYHVYNRGVAKQLIFIDNLDRLKLISIISRHLDPTNKSIKSDGTYYRKFNQDLELLCYCLMGNHFHMLLYLKGDLDALHLFMQSAITAYTMYFNKRHKRVGTLFQSVFKASSILNETYLMHISRYIHLNPPSYKTYAYSSFQYYITKVHPVWINPDRILNMFQGVNYAQFVDDYADYASTLQNIKHELANFSPSTFNKVSP